MSVYEALAWCITHTVERNEIVKGALDKYNINPNFFQKKSWEFYTIRSVGISIEGFHVAVRTPYALRPGRHVGFFLNNKICFNFESILFEKIKLTVSERTYIIVPMV